MYARLLEKMTIHETTSRRRNLELVIDAGASTEFWRSNLFGNPDDLAALQAVTRSLNEA